MHLPRPPLLACAARARRHVVHGLVKIRPRRVRLFTRSAYPRENIFIEPQLRISAIVDACFILIVDGVSG
ncbi:MAG: hypothetical protein RBR52_15120 [Thiomonas sp.]|uniref:hypothetical protein n=1 Tax=Thiomonas sp. TaxID=2047785 RepID=UPI002A3701BF|nr:hypothetical protein [Thiomonas sp.]MDY0331808.1 hypothetical protein [Thiomonas sp.]